MSSPIVLYDGECGLCDRSVRWLIRHDHAHALRYAPLQGDTAAQLRLAHPEIPRDIETVVLVEDGRVHVRSKAFLHVSKYLDRPWRWAHAFRWFPAFLLDPFYRLLAKVRYRIWGKKDVCELPPPEERRLFLA